MHVLARFDLPYSLFGVVAALRALESDHMRINACHLRMPPSRLWDQGNQRDTRQEVPRRHRPRFGPVGSLDRPMMLKTGRRPKRFPHVAAWDRMPADAPL